MPTLDDFDKMKMERERQVQKAIAKLNELAETKITLERPVFFIPGWTDEKCVCWKAAYIKKYRPIKEWISAIVKNKEYVNYVTFTIAESKACSSFLDFGDVLKTKVSRRISRKQNFDFVGHSMGGLDAVAAIVDDENPLRNVHNLITVATPHQGSQLGELGPIFNKYPKYHAIQCVNLDPDQHPIRWINEVGEREKLLERVNKLYCLMGSRDMAVMRSARFDVSGLDKTLVQNKVDFVEQIGGATHSQKAGITQDPRAMLMIINLLVGIEPEQPKYNYGYIYRKQ